jgi:hypothetical protein
LGGDDSDSGSQVIALEDSEAFDENANTMLRPAQPSLIVEDVATAPLGQAPSVDIGAMLGGAGQPVSYAQAPGAVQAAPPEAPYSVWNVLGLMSCALVLMITGMLMMDLMMNMWAFDKTQMVSTGVMDAFLSAFNLD